MKTLRISIEHHFLEVGGVIYTDIAFDYAYWSEYLSVFDEVQPIARMGTAAVVPPGWIRADGPGVRFHKIFDYLGFWHFLRCWPRVWRDCGRATAAPGPILMRMGVISLMCWFHAMRRRRPYGFEVIGNPREAVRTVENVQSFGLSRLIGMCLNSLVRTQARRAACASYVSRYVRDLYPTRSGKEWVFSSVRLPESAFAPPRAPEAFRRSPLRIVCVGRIEPEKGHRVLIQALAELSRRGGPALRLDIAGPGSQTETLRKLAADVGLSETVRLLGRIPPGEPLTKLLDASDLFVLPSLTEGMPRALIEAMARALPAIGSRAGGIPELLEADCLVDPGDSTALANRIAEVAASPGRLAEMSARNLTVARSYHQEIMNERKHEFWRCIQAAADGRSD